MSRHDDLVKAGFDPYPASPGITHSLNQARLLVDTSLPISIAGRLVSLGSEKRSGIVQDATGSLPFLADQLLDDGLLPYLAQNDIVACTGILRSSCLHVSDIQLLTPCLDKAPPEIPPASLTLRAAVLRHIRRFFDEQGFLEVDTPTLMTVPDLTPALASFQTVFEDVSGHAFPLYLQTSPEHAMKRLLAAGYNRIYQICRFYRNGERYATHHPEFTGLEWYEAYGDYHQVMKTTEELIASLCVAITGTATVTYQGCAIDLNPPWSRLTVREAFQRNAGVDLDACGTVDLFRGHAAELGYQTREDDTWDDLFHRLFALAVEPALPSDRPIFLFEYPAHLPSLAKHKTGDHRYVERFELYIGGLELGNAFTELNDPEEQHRRFEEQRAAKREHEGYTGPVDEALLAALRFGMPPAGGIAIGLDRLLMLFADAPTIDGVLPFQDIRPR